MDRRTEELLERIAVAVEKLNEEPILHIEGGPPMCPNCEAVNPEITVKEDNGEGPFSQFIVNPTCETCGNPFYAIPLSWAVFTHYGEAEQELNNRAEAFGV
jgi:hypothetical protein